MIEPYNTRNVDACESSENTALNQQESEQRCRNRPHTNQLPAGPRLQRSSEKEVWEVEESVALEKTSADKLRRARAVKEDARRAGSNKLLER